MQCVFGSSCPAKIGGAAYFKALKEEARPLCRSQHRKLSGASCRASRVQYFKTKLWGGRGAGTPAPQLPLALQRTKKKIFKERKVV